MPIEIVDSGEANGESVVDWLAAQEDRATVKFDNLSASGKGPRPQAKLAPFGAKDKPKGDSRSR